jgi:predicted Zn finger-like uncharacterized protein
MRIVCPSCVAAYDVPEPVLVARRTLRCTRCGSEFVAAASPHPVPVPVPVPSTQAEPPETTTRLPDMHARDAQRLAPGPAAPAARTQKWRAATVLAGWALSGMLIAAGGWAGFAWRGAIMQAWPPATRIYAVLGILH